MKAFNTFSTVLSVINSLVGQIQLLYQPLSKRDHHTPFKKALLFLHGEPCGTVLSYRSHGPSLLHLTARVWGEDWTGHHRFDGYGYFSGVNFE